MAYPIGSTVRLSVSITNITPTSRDPSRLFVKVYRPDGNLAVYEYLPTGKVIRTGVGLFYIDILLSFLGDYVVVWSCEDAIRRPSALTIPLNVV